MIGEERRRNSERMEMIEGVYDEFNRDEYLAGDVAPVFLVLP